MPRPCVGLLLMFVLLACADEAQTSFVGHEPRAPGQDAGQDAGLSSRDALPDQLLWDDSQLAHALEQGHDLRILDARSREAFIAGHIPGSVSLDVSVLRTEVDGVAGQIPAPDAVAARFGAARLSPQQPTIVYSDNSDLAAARMLWTLAYMGHLSAHMLDGGFARWQRADRSTEQGEGLATEQPPYPSDEVDATLRVDAQWVLDHLDDSEVVLIDARSASEFAAGHIPGALSLDWQGNVEGGVLRSLDALQARHADVPTNRTVVAYCQTGSRASMAWLTLRHLGYPDARLYDGSMDDWTQDPARPLESQ